MGGLWREDIEVIDVNNGPGTPILIPKIGEGAGGRGIYLTIKFRPNDGEWSKSLY